MAHLDYHEGGVLMYRKEKRAYGLVPFPFNSYIEVTMRKNSHSFESLVFHAGDSLKKASLILPKELLL